MVLDLRAKHAENKRKPPFIFGQGVSSGQRLGNSLMESYRLAPWQSPDRFSDNEGYKFAIQILLPVTSISFFVKIRSPRGFLPLRIPVSANFL